MAALRRHVVADFLQNAIAMPRRYGKRDKGDGGVTTDSGATAKANITVVFDCGVESSASQPCLAAFDSFVAFNPARDPVRDPVRKRRFSSYVSAFFNRSTLSS